MGSSGDVHPFVGLGLALKARGHDVTMITGAHFEPLVRRIGLDCVVLGTVEDFEAATQNRQLWNARKGLHVVARLILPFLPRLYELIAERYEPGRTVVVAAGLAFGARIANEKLGVPLATVHLQPFCFRSVHEMPVLPMLAVPSWCPRTLKRLLYWLGDLDADRAVAADTNAFRATLGLPPVKHLFGDWWNSCVLRVATNAG